MAVSESTFATDVRQPIRIRPNLAIDVWASIRKVLDVQVGSERAAAWLRLESNFRSGNLAGAAVCLILADLHHQGWDLEADGEFVWATPPLARAIDGETPEVVKERLRGWLRHSRAEQLQNPSVRAFITQMETKRLFGGKRVSVLNLVDDGHSLANAIADAARLPPSVRPRALAQIIRPQLVVIQAGATCQFTGLALMDVWRYFRHTWSLEYRPTPGRSLFFLIRNVARENAPVMAIGALANPTLQMRVRDDRIGWSSHAFLQRIRSEPGFWRPLHASMLRTLEEGLGLIRSDDILNDIGSASNATVETRLLAIASDAKKRRETDLTDRNDRFLQGESLKSLRHLPIDEEGRTDWREASSAPLFVSKRARALADILFARRILKDLPDEFDLSLIKQDVEQRFYVTDSDVNRAFAIAAREIRKVGLASRVLELNVCGAVTPYGELLAGKLAALAVASAEIRQGYSDRYSRSASEIASQMAGREVYRAVDVCTIGTTSLYGLAASQYNRLKLSVPSVTGAHNIAWEDLGVTEGYGTTQFGEKTVGALRKFSVEMMGRRHVNNVFGEGQSPRLRQIREALDGLGLDSDGLLKHSTPRRVYSLDLFNDARERLCLNEPADATPPSFDVIADAWLNRWLAPRVTYRPALDRIAHQGPATVRADLAAPDGPLLALIEQAPADQTPAFSPQPWKMRMPTKSNPELIQNLYRSTAACADHHDAPTVRLLHIETTLDDFLRSRAKEGGAIFVTGNPGDGKTHLLRRLEADLAAAKVEVLLDANEENDAAILSRVDTALKRKGRGIAVAINEGILVTLLQKAGERSWAQAARDQLMNPFVYRDGGGTPDKTVCVVDLNLRNNLSSDVVRQALERLQSLSAPCGACPKVTCGLQMNAGRLYGRALDRLTGLLGMVAKTGLHATMRDVQGFLSYLLSHGNHCEDFTGGLSGTHYWQNAFEGGQGPLFDSLRSLDPHLNTIPLLDDLLWRGADNSNDWEPSLVNAPPLGDSLDERHDAFVSRKRRALFEHVKGDSILAATGGPLDQIMAEVLRGTPTAVKKVVRLLNHFYDKDEERSDLLHLWVTHRYDAQPSRFAASSVSVPSAELEMLTPLLRPEISDAFPDFQPTFGLLCLKGQPTTSGLRIDRPLLAALLTAEQGMPSTFRRSEPEARITAFFDRVAKIVGASSEEIIEVRLVDMDTGANHRVAVNIRQRTYVQP
jgi:hypothetical protein